VDYECQRLDRIKQDREYSRSLFKDKFNLSKGDEILYSDSHYWNEKFNVSIRMLDGKYAIIPYKNSIFEHIYSIELYRDVINKLIDNSFHGVNQTFGFGVTDLVDCSKEVWPFELLFNKIVQECIDHYTEDIYDKYKKSIS
jgi:hypothetical protein